MKVVVSVDSFKGSLSSMQAGNAIKEGIEKCSNAEVVIYPLSDGGEGFVESYMSYREGVKRFVEVKDAMNRDISTSYMLQENPQMAIMEMASMCGIDRIDKAKKEVLYATTYGLGQMILDALDQGCRSFVIGIGGSGSNDGGSGMLQALGYELLDAQGKDIPLGAIGLSQLHHIQIEKADARLKECEFKIACDVKNPLVGINGCSAIFGPQKGADKDMVIEMDTWMKSYGYIVSQTIVGGDPHTQGSGAAGGLGFAFLSFLKADLISGIQLIMEKQHIRDSIENSDYVVTGEGCLDAQSVMGKAPTGIAKLAKLFHKPVIAFAGNVSSDADLCNTQGIDAFFCIQSGPCTLEDAMCTDNAYHNLSKTAEQVFRLLQTK